MTGRGLQSASDDELLQLYRREGALATGRAAASELFSRHTRRTYLWCRRYARDHERAMELAQETMLNAYRALPRFEGRAQFGSWLFAIARNVCLKAARGPAWLIDPEAEPDGLPHPGDDPEREFEELRDEVRLRSLLERTLDEDERRALWLRCEEKLPVEEIGRILRLENATGARALLQRARRKLRAALERAEEVS
jgi:RNA polymerase sigma-70 factor (ECF subfamily)